MQRYEGETDPFVRSLIQMNNFIEFILLCFGAFWVGLMLSLIITLVVRLIWGVDLMPTT
jgi:hypothetical protein